MTWDVASEGYETLTLGRCVHIFATAFAETGNEKFLCVFDARGR